MGKTLDVSITRATQVLSEACNARAAALWLAEPGILSGLGEGMAINADPVADYLSEVVKSGWRRLAGEKNKVHQKIHKSGFFVWVPLRDGGQPIGAIALDIATKDWETPKVPELLLNMSPLVAMVAANSLLTHELEADLIEAIDRASKLERDGEIDQLTKLENKTSFEAKCIERLNRDRRPVAMLALDLDDFKQVNDVYGHLFGDRYLTEVASALRTNLPNSCIIGRTGGDEFCILIEIPQASRTYLRSTFRNIRQAIQRCMATLGKPDLGGVSIGVSLFPTQATTFKALLGLADCALYASKRTERNGTTVYSSKLEGLMEPADLRDGSSRFQFDRLVAQLQPIVDLKSQTQTGLEILARWRDPSGSLRMPDSFSWAFRDHRFASDVTTHVVDSALEQLCVTCGLPPDTIPDLWINVTDSDFLNTDFVFDLQSVFERYRVDWNKIILEVNEDTIVGARNGLVFNSLKEVRRRGGRVALDDFGTGQSGLTHACQWPVDIIKIDRSIVQALGSDDKARVIAEAIVMVGDRLGQKVLAEGIETEAHLRHAADVGCQQGQGFLFGRAVDAQDLFLDDSNKRKWAL